MIGKILANQKNSFNSCQQSINHKKNKNTLPINISVQNLNNSPTAYYNRISFGNKKENFQQEENQENISNDSIEFFPEDLEALSSLNNINEQLAYLVYLRDNERYTESDN